MIQTDEKIVTASYECVSLREIYSQIFFEYYV